MVTLRTPAGTPSLDTRRTAALDNGLARPRSSRRCTDTVDSTHIDGIAGCFADLLGTVNDRQGAINDLELRLDALEDPPAPAG